MSNNYIRHDLKHSVGHAVEEAGELLAALGKTLRWGWDSTDPTSRKKYPETNRKWVQREIADLRGALDRLEAAMKKELP